MENGMISYCHDSTGHGVPNNIIYNIVSHNSQKFVFLTDGIRNE